MIKNTNMIILAEIEYSYDGSLTKITQDPSRAKSMNIFCFKRKKYVLFSTFPRLSYLDIKETLKGLKRIDHY